MKTVLLQLLVFISLHATAQMQQALKIKPIFASQQYVITVSNSQGVNSYQFVKEKTPQHTCWLLTTNNKTHKTIWNNYCDFEWRMTKTALAYFMDSLTTKPILPNDATYTFISLNQSISFRAPYMNLEKHLCHAGTMGDDPGYHSPRRHN